MDPAEAKPRVGRPYVTCTTCSKDKAPVGRSVPAVTSSCYCHPTECKGYYEEPYPDYLFPGESSEYVP